MIAPRGYFLGAAAVLAGMALGCSTAPPNLKTPMPEQFVVPPEDDPRYSRPLEYPKELLNKPPPKPSTPGMPGSGARQTPGGGMGGGPGPGM